MQFPHSYFEDEVRDGFYVPGMMKRSWAAQLEVLEDIDKVCKKHNIKYYAEWGTLLGTVRHGGVIPWDDDMDIGMKRADYNKFLTVAKKELPEGYGLLNFHDCYNGDFTWEFMTRVVNKDRICFDEDFLEKFHGFPFITGIDIFPLDFLAEDPETEEQRDELTKFVLVTADLVDEENKNIDTYEVESQLCQIEELCNVKIDRKGLVKQQLYLLAERLFSLYDEQGGSEVTQMILWLANGKYKLPSSYYQNLVMLPFENFRMPVPIGYDGILKRKYGNYMRAVHRGGSHGYPCYKEQEEILYKRLGIMPLRYDVEKILKKIEKI